MHSYEVVSKEAHQHLRWIPNNNFKFTAQDSLCPLLAQEAPKAALHLPIAFSKTDEQFGLFAVQSLEPNNNYLVDGNGRWLAGYIPAAYQAYPFALAADKKEQQVLCVDKESGLLNKTEGHEFFDSEGGPSTPVKEKLNLLSQVSAKRQTTHSLCLLLDEHQLLEPWPIIVKKNDKDVPIEGLYRVNEKKFNNLSSEALITLRDKGAIPLIFCQLLSMQNLARIAQWAKPASTAAALPDELAFDFDTSDGNISFEGL